jgi:hypothetical protein
LKKTTKKILKNVPFSNVSSDKYLENNWIPFSAHSIIIAKPSKLHITKVDIKEYYRGPNTIKTRRDKTHIHGHSFVEQRGNKMGKKCGKKRKCQYLFSTFDIKKRDIALFAVVFFV